jgi:hypothetical protein
MNGMFDDPDPLGLVAAGSFPRTVRSTGPIRTPIGSLAARRAASLESFPAAAQTYRLEVQQHGRALKAKRSAAR